MIHGKKFGKPNTELVVGSLNERDTSFSHCPKLNMNEKKTSKFQFNFPTLLGPCPMLKKLSKKNSFLGPPR